MDAKNKTEPKYTNMWKMHTCTKAVKKQWMM